VSSWDPDLYRRFDAERSAPFWDLVELVETDRPIRTMVDLGCGDGELSIEAADRLGADDLLGLDTSASMLARAADRATATRRFADGDLATWTSAGDVDLVFANASLQWVPDHPTVLGRWAEALAPGGQLAVQVPANGDHPSHATIDEVAATAPFLDAFGGTPPPNPVTANVLLPERYAELLHDLGFQRQHVRLQVYGHVLPTSSAVVDWVRGTNLTRIFAALPAELHDPFLAAYRSALLARIGRHEPYFFAFKRILMWARR
jgi:trans-aconitate 2-methyltransferase